MSGNSHFSSSNPSNSLFFLFYEDEVPLCDDFENDFLIFRFMSVKNRVLG
jgi:hypothetical protein